jgi:hypothetical protein
MELLDDRGAREDQDEAHDDRAQDAPVEHAGLELGRNGEVLEDHQEHEQVVHAERELDDVSGEELHRFFMAFEEVEAAAERKREEDEEPEPQADFLHRDFVGFPLDVLEVDHQDRRDDDIECNPKTDHERRPPFLGRMGSEPKVIATYHSTSLVE